VIREKQKAAFRWAGRSCTPFNNNRKKSTNGCIVKEWNEVAPNWFFTSHQSLEAIS
jgi:hypothetical protein